MELFYFIGAILGGIIIGGICGLIPLVLAILRKKVILGVIAIIICSLFGVIMTTLVYQPAFLSVFPALIMVGIILLLTRGEPKI